MIEEIEICKELFISNDRCIFDRTTSTLALADLHLGYEGAARKDGVYFPKVQFERVREALTKALDNYEPEKVVVNGDLKHTFDRNLGQEYKEIKKIYGLLRDRVDEVILVRGNHDNFLMTILPDDTDLPYETTVGRLMFVHGHRPPEDREDGKGAGKGREGGILVLAHEHPSLLLRDKIGASIRLPCFLYHPEDGILILPAFGTLSTGSHVMGTGFMSKALQDHEPGEFRAYAVSEIGLLELGRLADVSPPPVDVIDTWEEP